MEYDVFDEGIEPGGLRNSKEIGILICFILEKVGKPFAMNDLTDIIQSNGMANYFETTASISELINNNNIVMHDDADKMLEISDNGKMIASQLHTDLPLTIRQKAVAAVSRLEQRKKSESENPVYISEDQNGGYNVTLVINDKIRDLMRLTIFVPDKRDAENIKNTFYDDPEKLYAIVLAAMIGDKDLIKNALTELENE